HRALAERAFDDAWREATAAVAGGSQLRQLDDFDGAGAVGQAADEAAFLQRRNEAVNSGFRAQVERVLHLVEGGRYAGFLQPFIDETQKFILFARKHLEHSPGWHSLSVSKFLVSKSFGLEVFRSRISRVHRGSPQT